MDKWQVSLLVIVVSTIAIYPAYAAPGDLCVENYECSIALLTENPFSFPIDIFDELMAGFGPLVIWGPIVFGIWMVSKNTMITSVVGMIIAVSIIGIDQQALGVGLLLVALSMGIAIFQLFPRIKQPLT